MKRKIPLLFLCLLFLGITIFSGYRFLQEREEYRRGEDSYQALTQYVRAAEEATVPSATEAAEEPDKAPPTHETQPQPTQPEQEIPYDWPEVDFEALKAINPDAAAWICLENTVINYPVVQGADNSYYLYRLFDGSKNSAGSIFMDYRNTPELTDRNTILYGHHLQSGTMFAAITKYKEQAYFDAHPYCLLMTPERNYMVEFFAGYVADLNGDSWKLQFGSDAEFEAWLAAALEKSTFQSSVVPTAQDRILTLSTCSYEFNDARYVLLGVLR